MTPLSPHWDVVDDIRQMWSLPFMVNAFRAGALAAVCAAAVGWFAVARRQTFAAHTLSVVTFPGAAGAVLIGLPVAAGYYLAALIAAGVLARGPGQSAVIGTVQAFALACGLLFATRYGGFLGGPNAVLFGSFLGITTGQIAGLAAACAAIAAAIALTWRPLLFVSMDRTVAAARGLPARALDAGFLALLALATAAVAQVTGSLLVFALLVLPAATGQHLSARPATALALAAILGVTATWIALSLAYYTPYPVGFWLTTTTFGLYAAARVLRPSC